MKIEKLGPELYGVAGKTFDNFLAARKYMIECAKYRSMVLRWKPNQEKPIAKIQSV